MITFDILGEMAFGEGFDCVKNEKHHAWMDLILKHLFEVTLVDNLRRIKILHLLGTWLLPSLTEGVREKHAGYSRQKVQKRLDAETPRQDFLTHIAKKVRASEVEQEEMTAHASTLM